MWQKIKSEYQEFKLLMRSTPPLILTLFILSVFSMNLLANKSISLPFDWLALDCGIIVSWFAFLTMDILTKHFGPKASTQISILAICVNLLMCLLFFVGSKIAGTWAESYPDSELINNALNNTFGGTWYVLLGSTIAFVVSAVVNNFTNWGIGKTFKKNPDGIGAYILRTYVSTAIGQFVDNITFAFIVSHIFFGWTATQCIFCALTGMVVELLCEVVFSPLGYWVCKKWSAENVGVDYLNYKKLKETK